MPVCKNFSGYDKIMLTGGEPLLQPDLIRKVVKKIRAVTKSSIILYTAKTDHSADLLDMLRVVDGLTLTLHTRKDVAPFMDFTDALKCSDIVGKSLRLNVFRGIDTGAANLSGWRVKNDIQWIKDCPLPDSEVFMRLDHINH